MKVAFFDFCGTIVTINTLSRFVDFVISDHRVVHRHVRKQVFSMRRVLSTCGILSCRELELRCLAGVHRDLLEQLGRRFCDQVVLRNLNAAVTRWARRLKDLGHQVVILSAGLELYIERTREVLPVDQIVATELAYGEHGLCLGKVDGIDPVGPGKIAKLKQRFPCYDRIEFEDSYFFTNDPVSDGQALDMVGHPVVVASGNQSALSRALLDNSTRKYQIV